MFPIQILILLFNIIYASSNIDIYENSIVTFWTYTIVLLIEIINKKKISILIIFWIAFLYMIPKEGIQSGRFLQNIWGVENVNKSFLYLILSSSIIFISYKIAEQFNLFKVKEINKEVIINKPKILLSIIIIYNILFFLINISNTLYGLQSGRASAFPYSFSSLLYALAFLSIGLLVKLKKNKLNVILISLPIIITFIGTGTRFFLIFIIFIIFFEDLYNLTKKRAIQLVISAIVIVFITNFIKDARSIGLLESSTLKSKTVKNKEFRNITEKIVSYGSSEGLIKTTSMITSYQITHPYTMGKSIGFITIFWIPREVWPNKPVMLDSWLIRNYTDDVSEGFSTASSYGGEIYMDFGFILGNFVMVFFGIGLFYINTWIIRNNSINPITFTLSGFLYGWIFFGTRSIMTSTFMLVYIIVCSYIIYKQFVKFKIFKIQKK